MCNEVLQIGDGQTDGPCQHCSWQLSTGEGKEGEGKRWKSREREVGEEEGEKGEEGGGTTEETCSYQALGERPPLTPHLFYHCQDYFLHWRHEVQKARHKDSLHTRAVGDIMAEKHYLFVVLHEQVGEGRGGEERKGEGRGVEGRRGEERGGEGRGGEERGGEIRGVK